MPGGGLDDRAHPLPPLAVGQADDGHVPHFRVGVEDVLDLLGADVLAFADDDVLHATREHEVAVVAQVAEIARPEETFLVEGVGGERRVGVALADHGAADPDLAVDVRPGDRAVEGHDLDLGVDDGLPVGVGQLVVGVGRRTHRDHRHLGHAIAVHDRDPHLPLDLEVDLRWLRRPTTRQQAQGGDDLLARLLALFGEEGAVEGRAPPRHRHAQTAVDLDGVGRHERLHENGWEPAHQDGHEVVGAGDVAEGKGDRAHVVGRHVEGDGQASSAGDEGAVAVLHALGVGRRARRVVDPAHGLVGGVRDGRQSRRVGFRKPVVDDEELGLGVELTEDPRGHGIEIEPPPHPRDHEQAGLQLLEGEAHLTLPVDVQNRVLHGPEPRQRHGQDDGVHARRELPRDRRALADPPLVQTGGDALGPTHELREGEPAPGLVEQHAPVGRLVHPPLEQLPQRPPFDHARMLTDGPSGLLPPTFVPSGASCALQRTKVEGVSYFIATGVTGEPVAAVKGCGDASSRNE